MIFKIGYVCQIPQEGGGRAYLANSLCDMPITCSLFRRSRHIDFINHYFQIDYFILSYPQIIFSVLDQCSCFLPTSFCKDYQYEPRHDKINKMSVRPAKTDQPGHPPSLIRVFAVRMKKAWVLSYTLSAQRRL